MGRWLVALSIITTVLWVTPASAKVVSLGGLTVDVPGTFLWYGGLGQSHGGTSGYYFIDPKWNGNLTVIAKWSALPNTLSFDYRVLTETVDTEGNVTETIESYVADLYDPTPGALLINYAFDGTQVSFQTWRPSFYDDTGAYTSRRIISGGLIFQSAGPNNALFTVSTDVPEPATWALLLVGFGTAGAMVRRRLRASYG